MMNVSRKILVLGGTGSVGRIMADELRHLLPDADITLSARRLPATLAPGLRGLPLDVRNERALREALSGMDLVVMAAGPFDQLASRVHLACVDAGVDLVDINDSDRATSEILQLEHVAASAGVRILTGMGFVPGLSTLLLVRIARERAYRAAGYRMVLYMGALNAGGPSNGKVLLDGFRQELPALENGAFAPGSGAWRKPDAGVRFPGSGRSLKTLPFASPEFHTLAEHDLADRLGIRSLESRYHVQFLHPAFGRLLSSSGLLRSERLKSWLSEALHRSGKRLRSRTDADDTTSLMVSTDADATSCQVHGPVETRHITANVAAAAVSLLLSRKTDIAPGVHSMERVLTDFPDAQVHIETHLKRRGIIIHHAVSAEDGHRFENTFGQCATFDGTAESLRHFGLCWYHLEHVPPRITRLQQQILRESRLWKAVMERTSGARRASLMLRMKWRHFRLMHESRHMTFGLCGPKDVNRRILNDFCLFAAGYQEARELLGHDARSLYAEMFLESGRMEMSWFWPSAHVFAASDRPMAVFSSYLNAYFAACQRLGVSMPETALQPGSMEIRFSGCTYGAILSAMGCGELDGLVRQMELDAIRRISDACGISHHWTPGRSGGQGQLVLHEKSRCPAAGLSEQPPK